MHITTYKVSIYQGGTKDKLTIDRKAWRWNFITDHSKKNKKEIGDYKFRV